MSRTKITQEIVVYEINGKAIWDATPLKVISHVTYFVVLEIGGNRYTVSGENLKTAIDNAMNTGD